jgi:hypothetical protein
VPVSPPVNVDVTELGLIAPRVKVMAGVVVGFATVPETPLCVTTDTDVTDPEPPAEDNRAVQLEKTEEGVDVRI